MIPEQEEKFEKWWGPKDPGLIKFSSSTGWQACLEANGIGEDVKGNPYRDEVDAPAFMPPIDWESRPWATEVRVAYCSASMGPDRIGDRIMTIKRPVPTWKPKDGEAVLTRVFDKAEAGAFKDGHICVRDMKHRIEEVGMDAIKPFDASKIGKPWSEI